MTARQTDGDGSDAGSKRWALYAGLFFLGLAVAGYVFRGELLGGLISWRIGPTHDFATQAAPPAPDYTQATSWAALPGTPSPADARPDGMSATPEKRSTPVFFVHPTSYFGKTHWNQPLDNGDANWVVDERVLRHQASVFNSCCSIYAPRYRQATFYSFIENGSNAAQALQLAYDDVEQAFDSFLSRIDPASPFILAGHSQGTRHAAELLRERIADTPLAQRLVAAYLVGFSIENDAIGSVPVCSSATETNCAVGWNSIAGNGRGIFAGIDNLLCVNPLSWKTDGNYVAHESNKGAIGFAAYGPAKDDEQVDRMALEPAVADAHCKNGQLFVPDLRSESFPQRMQGNSLHVYDYSLFHMNIRDNAQQRVSAYLQRPSK